jgi:hypothetical protein
MRSELHQPVPSARHENSRDDSDEVGEDLVSELLLALSLIGLLVFVVLPGIAALSLL